MTTPDPKFVDIHVLRSVPFSNMNRDDLGQPKTVPFGGRTRARISSQCIKRAVRLDMQNNRSVEGVNRTRLLPSQVAGLLAGDKADSEFFAEAKDKAEFAAAASLASVGFNPYNDNLGATDILTFLPRDAAQRIADVIAAAVDGVDNPLAGVFDKRSRDYAKASDGKKRASQIDGAVKDLNANHKSFVAEVREVVALVNPMIACMGRMSTAMPVSNVDGAVQVAHAFTTHASSNEPDYFTAVDDLNPAEDTGAGFLGTSDYVTGVFYQYACLDIRQFRSNCDIDDQSAAETVAAFVASFAESSSGAKKTTTAPHTPPSLVMVNVRSDRPVNFANAFERPVVAGCDGGFIEPSVKALVSKSKRRSSGIVKSWIDLEDEHAGIDLPNQVVEVEISIIADQVRDFFAAGCSDQEST